VLPNRSRFGSDRMVFFSDIRDHFLLEALTFIVVGDSTGY